MFLQGLGGSEDLLQVRLLGLRFIKSSTCGHKHQVKKNISEGPCLLDLLLQGRACLAVSEFSGLPELQDVREALPCPKKCRVADFVLHEALMEVHVIVKILHCPRREVSQRPFPVVSKATVDSVERVLVRDHLPIGFSFEGVMTIISKHKKNTTRSSRQWIQVY